MTYPAPTVAAMKDTKETKDEAPREDPRIAAAKKTLDDKQKALDEAAETQAKAHLDYTAAQRDLVRIEGEVAAEATVKLNKEAEEKLAESIKAAKEAEAKRLAEAKAAAKAK